MSNQLLDGIITIVVGAISTLSKVPGFVGENLSKLNDFIYVRYFGLPFIVLGARQTGKTTLIEWLHKGAEELERFDPEPTPGGGDPVARFNSRLNDETVRLNLERDVGGEYAMWEADWVELFRETQPAGIIIMIDHQNPALHKDALNFVLQMMEEEDSARRKLRALLVLVNKYDLWQDDTNMEDILKHYRNEMRRIKLLKGRLNLWYEIHSCSLLEDVGVEDAMRGFLNAIRPRPKKGIVTSEQP